MSKTRKRLMSGAARPIAPRAERMPNIEDVLPNHVLPEDIPTLIRKTAIELCGAFYEMNRTPQFRNHWKDQNVYVALCWAHFVPTARDVLLAMLQRPDISEHLKTEIYDAFIEQGEKRQTFIAPSMH